MKTTHHFTRTPTPVHRARLDNIAIVPASMLPTIKRWQALANELPAGSVLIASPCGGSQTRTLKRVAQLLTRHGHTVRLIACPARPAGH